MGSRVPVAIVASLFLLQAACAKSDSPTIPARTSDRQELVVQVASYDLAVGRERRFIVGLLTSNSEPISGGSVTLRFERLADKGKESTPGPEVTASFLPIPKGGEAHGGKELPEGFGVYSARVAFDVAGFWQVTVGLPKGSSGPRSGKASFEVGEKTKVPAPGDPALLTDNHTVSSPADVPRSAIDSRASAEGVIPDAALHRTTIKAAIESGKPVLVVFSTPTYCTSRFCGPVTDEVGRLAADYADTAEFIHIEIWRDKQNNAINKAAADWLLRDDDLQEPWVFLIGRDGKIVERWDNVATRAEVEAALKVLL